MLVFSLHKETDGTPHPIAQCLKRNEGITEEKLVGIVSEINAYLPDDWRMTNEKSLFRILVSVKDILFTLDGQSFRYSNGIIHILDTVLTPSMGKVGAIGDDKRQPNLYYFSTRPDYSASPLFARQFEKVRYNNKGEQSGTQYHRIHPLTKSGIDPDHYHWVKWISSSGHIFNVEYPETDYHGKNYWVLKDLAEASNRASDIKPYLTNYNKITDNYLKNKPLSPEYATSPYELECKLLWPDISKQDFDDLHSSIVEKLEILDLRILLENKSFTQSDIYFDDDKRCLYFNGMSFRIRKKTNYVQISLKAKPPEGKETIGDGWYRRFEEESPISKEQERLLLAGQRISALPCRLISYLAPHCGILSPVIEVKTRRTVIEISNDKNQRAQICMDRVSFLFLGETIDADVEIEIESKGMPRKDIEAIAEFLKELPLKPVPSKMSKYERAINYALKLEKSGWMSM